ncbi:MAG: hypothetical protein AB8G11_23260 [Saprospiraceae bacterium]
MKKLLITAIILINCTTLYFWAFPYSNKQDLHAFLLADKTLKRQNQIIGTGCESIIRSIAREVRAYPEFNDYENKAMEIHELTKANYQIIQGLKDAIQNELPETYSNNFYMKGNYDEAFSLKYRIRPFQYRIPKKVMSNHLATEPSGQAKASEEITQNQVKILELIEVDSFRQIIKDSILVNVEELPQLFKKVNIMEAFSLLSGIQTQIRNAEYQLLTHLSIEVTNQTNRGNYQEFVPIVYANTSNLKIGDTYEAEIFAASYLNVQNTKAYADGKEIPVENGIAVYSVKPTSIGKKKVNIRMEVTNPLTKKTETFKRDFEYDVVNCN